MLWQKNVAPSTKNPPWLKKLRPLRRSFLAFRVRAKHDKFIDNTGLVRQNLHLMNSAWINEIRFELSMISFLHHHSLYYRTVICLITLVQFCVFAPKFGLKKRIQYLKNLSMLVGNCLPTKVDLGSWYCSGFWTSEWLLKHYQSI